jgi:hypothetical protein
LLGDDFQPFGILKSVASAAGVCRLVGHKRSKERARPVAGTWLSHCQLCEIQLVRIERGRWVPTSRLKPEYRDALRAAMTRGGWGKTYFVTPPGSSWRDRLKRRRRR